MADSENSGADEGQGQEAAESAKPQARPDTLRDLARALAGTPEESEEADSQEGSSESDDDLGDDGDGNEGESQQQRKPLPMPKDLNALAERLGVEVAELYKLTVPGSQEGESFTLGQLKDEQQKRSEFTVRELAFEEQRSKREAELMRAQAELEEIMAHLPKEALKSDNLRAAATRLEARASKERARTLDVIPEWRDESRRTSDLAAMVEHLKGYGFPTTFLTTINDHRTVRYIRENWLRQQRIENALAMVEQQHGKHRQQSKPNGSSPQRQSNAPRPKTPNDKRSKLVNLLQPSEG
jgi:hypothetical protein